MTTKDSVDTVAFVTAPISDEVFAAFLDCMIESRRPVFPVTETRETEAGSDVMRFRFTEDSSDGPAVGASPESNPGSLSVIEPGPVADVTRFRGLTFVDLFDCVFVDRCEVVCDDSSCVKCDREPSPLCGG